MRWLTILLLVAGWLAPLAPHAPDADPACAAAVALDSHESGLRESLTSSRDPEHCQVCHLARSFRTTVAEKNRIGRWVAAGQFIEAPPDPPARAAAFSRLPARAPPV